MSLSYVIRFSELDGLTNVTSSVEHLESRSLDERSRLGITCTGQHRVQIRNILRRVADRSQVALSATPVRPTGRTRFTGPIFERFFGTDNIGARTYVHERIDRVRRESLRTPGLRGFGLSRAMILCNEGYGSRDPCEPTDILITNRERSFMVLCPPFWELPSLPSQSNELTQVFSLFQALNICLHPFLVEGAADHLANLAPYTHFVEALYLDSQGQYRGRIQTGEGWDAAFYYGEQTRTQRR